MLFGSAHSMFQNTRGAAFANIMHVPPVKNLRLLERENGLQNFCTLYQQTLSAV
jgi:hypothetical protein